MPDEKKDTTEEKDGVKTTTHEEHTEGKPEVDKKETTVEKPA